MWQHGRARDRLAMLDTATDRACKSSPSHLEAFFRKMRNKRGIMRVPVAAVVTQCRIRHSFVRRSPGRGRWSEDMTCARGACDGRHLLRSDYGGETASLGSSVVWEAQVDCKDAVTSAAPPTPQNCPKMPSHPHSHFVANDAHHRRYTIMTCPHSTELSTASSAQKSVGSRTV